VALRHQVTLILPLQSFNISEIQVDRKALMVSGGYCLSFHNNPGIDSEDLAPNTPKG